MHHVPANPEDHVVDLIGEGHAGGMSLVPAGALGRARPGGRERLLADHHLRKPWTERRGVRERFGIWALIERLLPTRCELHASRESCLRPACRPDALHTARAWHAQCRSMVARRAHEHDLVSASASAQPRRIGA